VVVSARKIDLLRRRLAGDSDHVRFADMDAVGTNPARIIPAWRAFVDEHAGKRPFRGIGEPIWAGRSADELVECQRHEALLNLAFADTAGFELLCPYDTEALGPDVIEEAHRSHPFIVESGAHAGSTGYQGLDTVGAPFDRPLPEPPEDALERSFDGATLWELRRFVSRVASDAGMEESRTADLVMAVNEVATNTLKHTKGPGSLLMWTLPQAVICEIRDPGSIGDPLVGRRRPSSDHDSGRGLWLANQLCELIQIRSSAAGTVVRLHMRRR
jgi:anti-sigma regulatory factor (Ser/Thr protein kinase)